MEKIKALDEQQIRQKYPNFRAGDTVAVDVRIREGDKVRIQRFEGVVIQRRGGGVNKSFTVRKVSSGIGVERIFQLHSPNIANIRRLKEGRVRRAKIYYIRKIKGRAARIQEKR